jgi:1,4-dihydroxy-2-naphthoate octaprenyltransferase
VVPVAVGAACAVGEGGMIWWRVAAALVVSLGLQVGTNYANDYSDGVRGTDTARVGPVRLVASGLALAIAVGPVLLLVGAAAIAAGWFYTGGPKPYGYYGFGELFVFVFFGLVATAGTTYVVTERLTGLSVVAGAAVGALACALLVVNNLRDIPTDRAAGKKTLAVRLGDGPTRLLYQGLIAAAFVAAIVAASVWRLPAALVILAVPLGLRPVAMVRAGATGRELIGVLGATGQLQLGFGALSPSGWQSAADRSVHPAVARRWLPSPASPARRPMGDLHELAAAASRRSAAAARLRLRRGRAGHHGREGHGRAGVRDRRPAAVRRRARPGRDLPRHSGQEGDPQLRRTAQG